jgi:hypothetical protein
MKKVVHQLVVLSSGEIRIPTDASEVTHGHHSPDQQIKIEVPANKKWLLVEIQVELAEASSDGIEAVTASRPPDV